MQIWRIAVFVAMVVAIGCEKQNKDQCINRMEDHQSNCIKEKKVPEANVASNIAVVIEAQPITRNQLLRKAKSELILSMNKARKTKIGRSEFLLFRRYCRTAISREINQAAIARYNCDHGLKVSKDDINRQAKIFAKRFGVRSKKLKRWHTVDDLKYMLGKNASVIDDDIMAMAHYAVMTNNMFKSEPVVITDEMISNRLDAIARQNSIITATNAYIYARSTNIWNQIKQKEMTFEDAATKFSEDEYIAEGCEWGSFSMEQLRSETTLLEMLPTLKPGDITPPIESDGGLAIVRKDADEDSKTYSFSRIFFRLAMFCEEETANEAKAYLAGEMSKQRIRDIVKKYVNKLKIEYPNGTNVLGNITFSDIK